MAIITVVHSSRRHVVNMAYDMVLKWQTMLWLDPAEPIPTKESLPRLPLVLAAAVAVEAAAAGETGCVSN